jgi:hypothetical protein
MNIYVFFLAVVNGIITFTSFSLYASEPKIDNLTHLAPLRLFTIQFL